MAKEEEWGRRGGKSRRAWREGRSEKSGEGGGHGGLGFEEGRMGGSRIIIIQPLSNVLQR